MDKQTDQAAGVEQSSAVSAPRRRITRAALAAPVVLGSLASKQALGNVPYVCTVSGVLSNNLSPTDHRGGDCSTLGLSPGCWKQNDVNWARSTLFSSIFGGSSVPANATMIQVLCVQSYGKTINGVLNPCTHGGVMPFARAAVANLLNSLHFGAPANFPLTQAAVIQMFADGKISNGWAMLPGQSDPTKTYLWYFTMLYGGTTSNPDSGNEAQCPHGTTVPEAQKCLSN